MRIVRFTQSARRHRIGRARALEAMRASGAPIVVPAMTGLDDRLVFVGPDGRGLVLEVIAVDRGDHLLVIHVMPYQFRRRQ